jgi:signal transduction histidine kinase
MNGPQNDEINQRLLSELTQQLNELKSAVRKFSHDLRSPLSAAKLGAQLISRKATDPEFATLQANRIAQTLDRADQMIQDFSAQLSK